MAPFQLDPEIATFVAKTDSFYPPTANTATAAENRRIYDRMCAAFRTPYPPGVTAMDAVLTAETPARSLRLRRYTCAKPQPGVALLYLHGGGFVLGGLDSHDDVCAELCAGAAIAVVALDYRLAPEHPYPAALDDAIAAYASLRAAGQRVVVAGDSAGGNLTAALCLRLRRLQQPAPLGQVLIYPGLGGDPARAVQRGLAEAPLLSIADTLHYRAVYAGGADRIPKADPEFAPLQATEFTNLPPAAIFAAGIDPLCPDAEDYAAALKHAGVPVQYRNDPGLVHGHLRARHASRIAGACFAAIVRAVGDLARGDR